MQESLLAALEMQRAGRIDAAFELYEKILEEDDTNAAAWHSYGVLTSQQGDHARAIELIGRALALAPNSPNFYVNLAEAYRAAGDLRRAAGSCRTVLGVHPDFPEALCSLAQTLHGQGRPEEAVEHFRRALELRPRMVRARNNLGIILRGLGRHDEALGEFRKAVEIDPDFGPGRANLAQLLLDRGALEESLEHSKAAVMLQPDLPGPYNNLGIALDALGHRVEARASFLEALRLAPDLARSHSLLGLCLQGEGKLAEALPWLKKAAELAPDAPFHWRNLAELHTEREEHAQAIPCWEKVLALSPAERSVIHACLGWAYQEEGRLAEAGEHFRTAARLKPDSAVAQVYLGGLHEEDGEMAEAEAAYRKALEFQPNYAIPHARLATLLRGRLADADLASLERRLADPDLPMLPRARLLYGLGQVLDARGDYPRAAECARQANAFNLELARGRRDYVPEDHVRFVDAILEATGPDFFERALGAGDPTQAPVFVFGFPRSGTTLVEQVLSSHARIHGAGELRLSPQTFESLPEAAGLAETPVRCLAKVGPEGITRLAGLHLEKLRAHDGGRLDRVVDKLPENYIYLGLLAAMFPNATFIHCRRDLRDVAVSCWMTDFRSIRWASDPSHLAGRLGQYRRLMDHWRSTVPSTIHEVEYEDTVADLEGVARRLVAACGLEWDPACVEFHRTRRPVRTASIAQVRQPIYTRSVARWRNYEREFADLFAALPQDQMQEVG